MQAFTLTLLFAGISAKNYLKCYLQNQQAFGDFSGENYFSDKQMIAESKFSLTARTRVGAVRTCENDGKLVGLQVGLADFASLKSTRVKPDEVIWLTPIGMVSG